MHTTRACATPQEVARLEAESEALRSENQSLNKQQAALSSEVSLRRDGHAVYAGALTGRRELQGARQHSLDRAA